MAKSSSLRSRAWQGTERTVAKAWGGERRGRSARGGFSDVAGSTLSIEVTRNQTGAVHRAKIEQAKRNASAEGKPWLLVVAAPGQRVEEMTAVCSHGFLLGLAEQAGLIGKLAA